MRVERVTESTMPRRECPRGVFRVYMEADMTTPPPPVEILPEAFSVEQFCVFAGISYDTWQKLRKRGEGPREIRVGNSPRVLRTDAHEWLQSLRQPRRAAR
jgi:hypothetical protein